MSGSVKTLKRITGEKLILKFGPSGSLSSARFDNRDITSELRYLREDDYEDSLDNFGFRKQWDKKVVKSFSEIEEKLKEYNLSVFNATLSRSDIYNVCLCDYRDSSFIHKTARVVIEFDIKGKTFGKIVKLYDTDNAICEQLKNVKF